MNERAYTPEERAKISAYIERLASIQKAALELHTSGHQLRIDAGADRINPDVILTLAQIISNNPHDGGKTFLNVLFDYATFYGLQFKPFRSLDDNSPIAQADSETRTTATEIPRNAVSTPLNLRQRRPLINKNSHVYIQVALGLIVSGIFLGLLS